MFKHISFALLLGFLGLVIGCEIVQYAVSRWTELNRGWINCAMLAPLLSMWFGLNFAESAIGERRIALRRALALLCAVLGGAGNFLAFVITSRTWYADTIPETSRSFWFQLTHPDVLPALVFISGWNGSTRSTESWIVFLAVGCLIAPIVFWTSTRKPVRW